jgi:TetR/AcrR family transcriptional regulator, regulator of cefoperazone and chloramphenicol sensitivity
MKDSPRKSEDTKIKLIEAAGEVFAQRGFRSATVREICSRARTHVGAVNYHFRDKEGLYKAVLEHSHQTAMQKYPIDLGVREGASPEERLRAFIHSFLLRMLAEGFPAWHGKLMAQEISNPTSILEQMVQSSVRPLHMYLARVLRELLQEADPVDGEESERVFLCAMSIVGQCLHHYGGRHFIAVLHPKSFDPANIERITDHITQFSLGGIRALKTAD